MILNNILAAIRDILMIFCLLLFIGFLLDEQIETEGNYNIVKISKIIDIIVKKEENSLKSKPL